MLGFRQGSLIGGVCIPVLQEAGPIQTNEQTKTRQTTSTKIRPFGSLLWKKEKEKQLKEECALFLESTKNSFFRR